MPTTTDPRAERKRLEAELRSATEAGQEAGRQTAILKASMQELDAERLSGYEALARGSQQAAKEVEKAEKKRTALLADIERATVALEGARRARQNAEHELATLLHDDLATFVEDADRYTREAVDAFAAVEQPYREAVEAWRKAQAAWQPLLPAVRVTVQREEEERGVWSPPAVLAQASTVPAFPLPELAEQFGPVASGELVPRPAGLTPTDDEG